MTALTTESIPWTEDVEKALGESKKTNHPVLLDFTAAPMWGGCARLEAEVYPEARVSTFINTNFVPVRLHVKNHANEMKRFNVDWTPTVLLVDSDGKELYRIEGYLPVDDFLGQLQLGFGHAQFTRGNYQDAERQFRDVCEKLPGTDAAAEATYWAGVSRYKESHDAAALKATAQAFKDRYQNSIWAKKASIWS